MYQDEKLICEDCGNEFVFTAGEQEFYAEKGLANKPKRCPECRKIKKQHYPHCPNNYGFCKRKELQPKRNGDFKA